MMMPASILELKWLIPSPLPFLRNCCNVISLGIPTGLMYFSIPIGMGSTGLALLLLLQTCNSMQNIRSSEKIQIGMLFGKVPYRLPLDGWMAELKIPYSAIRFPEKPEQLWHINFGRLIQRDQQKSFWSAIDPKVDGFLNQSGLLTGVKGIKPPLRLRATPYVAGL